MANEGFLGLLFEMLIKLQVFVHRPSVQIQLVIILIILPSAGFVSNMVLVALRTRQNTAFMRKNKANGQSVITSSNQLIQRLWSTGSALLVLPLLSLIAIYAAILILQSLNDTTGLLSLLAFILVVLLIYRLFLLLLYISFPKKRVHRFEIRLFTPLFVLFVFYQMIELFGNVNNLGTVPLFANLLQEPITLGALFLSTVGLYFWVDSVLGLKELMFYILSSFTSFNKGRIDASLTLAGYILIGCGIALALNVLGLSSTSFAAILGGFSVGVGFAMKEILSNFVSGILLLFEGSIKPGDWVKVEDQEVLVKTLGIRATVVRNRNNIEVIVPNEKLLASPVTSYTATDPIIRLQLPFRGSYKSAPEQITQVLLETAQQNPQILVEPKSTVVITGFSDTGIHYELRVWIDMIKSAPPAIKNQLYRAIKNAFTEHDIDWMEFVQTPPTDIHLTNHNDKELTAEVRN